ncbi:hypothetical protein Q7O_000188 [Pectobacterium carotovorum subsp. carotovorum PCCS1]|nr:hypothetical protein [Pectobacterium carotovorum subsp. carotovorum PCCS1]
MTGMFFLAMAAIYYGDTFWKISKTVVQVRFMFCYSYAA